MRSKILCLMGPTASGKTDLSLQLARDVAGEIVSVDSAMVYKGMDIGTAKPSLEERAGIKHHLIDIQLPANPYSAAKFKEDALAAIAEIQTRGKVPILAGGTMLYFKALQQGLSPLPSADEEIRTRLSQEASVVGWQEMHARLSALDPLSGQRISPNDPQRIQRALEVYEITRKPLSLLWQMQDNQDPPFDFVNVAIVPTERSILHQRIADRFLKMIHEGFLEEVNSLYQTENLHINLPAMRSVGYRQAWQHLDGIISYEEFVAHGITATRQLAKRQLTWLRQWKEVSWFNSLDSKIYQKLLQFVTKEVIT